MYTLKEIIDAWENNYGGDMEKDYPRFFKELKKAASLTASPRDARMKSELV